MFQQLAAVHVARRGYFDPETVKVMQSALDDAWGSLRPDEQAKSSKVELAVHILEAAANGERDARLRIRALTNAIRSTL